MLTESFADRVTQWQREDSRFGPVLALLARYDEVHVVGGTVRDLLLGRAISDLDVAVPVDGIQIGRALARELQTAFFVLDAGRDVCRLVLDDQTHVDISRYREGSLAEDLLKRDFTINAMAWPIAAQPPTVIDVSSGLADLRAGLVRTPADDTLRDDPLRCLRAVRFANALGFAISASTLDCVERDRALLCTVSLERIRDEFLAILSAQKPTAGLEQLARLGLAPFAPGLAEDRLLCGAALLDKLPDDLAELASSSQAAAAWQHDLQQEPVPGRPRWLLCRLATVLWGALSKMEAWNGVCKRLVLSTRETEHVLRVLQGLTWLESWPDGWWRDPERIHAFYAGLGESGLDAAALFAAFGASVDASIYAREMQETLFHAWYRRHEALVSPPRLVTGDTVRRLTGADGAAIGRLLEDLTLAQVRGEVLDAEQAEQWLLQQP